MGMGACRTEVDDVFVALNLAVWIGMREGVMRKFSNLGSIPI
jgi:hypothetical protein